MKGVNKQVIEINEPDSETIEKVLVILRQKDGHINVARARQEVERYVETLVCWRRLPPLWHSRRLWAGLAAAALALAAGLFVLLR